MKRIAILICFISLISAGCNDKIPDVIPEDLLVKVLTDGHWSVTDYKLNGVDKTADFAGWRFKYYDNTVVEASFNTVVMSTGTWEGSQATMKFSANFPGATAPVTLVNGTWTVDQPGTRVVVASQTVGTDTKVMKLYRE
jgi:hypothetical protein